MDKALPPFITIDRLAERIADPVRRPIILDVRRAPAFEAAASALPGALRRAPETVGAWAAALEADRPVVAYCVHGHEVSQGVTAALVAAGLDAVYLEGGIEGWIEAGRPVAAKPGRPSVWVTRARPKIDRIACPWLIRRFIDPDAVIRYVPAQDVLAVAAAEGGEAFDCPGARFGHAGERCSFDSLIAQYALDDPALAVLARVVRGADTGRPDIAAEAAGLLAISRGLSALCPDDQAMLRHGLVIYDALYLWAGEARHALPHGATAGRA